MGEKERLNQITEAIIGAAIEVHRHLVPAYSNQHMKPVWLFKSVNAAWKSKDKSRSR